MIIICFGIDRLIIKHPRFTFFAGGFAILFSLLLLWRSYFVLFPHERAKIWGYGFKKLAEEIKFKPNSNFVIDQSRITPAYIQLAFYLQYPPEQFQKQVDQSIKENYYHELEFNSYYEFANIKTRNISWENDIYQDQILVGDELAISDQQAQEHFLEKVFEIRSPVDEIIFVGYKTNPNKKCENSFNQLHCKDI